MIISNTKIGTWKLKLRRWIRVANEVEFELMGIEDLITEVERLGKQGARIENKALREAGEVVKEAIQNETLLILEL